MIEQGKQTIDSDDPLKDWRQGDFALDVGGFLYASPADDDNKFGASEITKNIVGLIVISQTCDIVRRTGGRHYLSVSPLVEKNEEELSEILTGRRPYLADVENAGRLVFADLSRVMSVHKDVVKTWKRKEGFSNRFSRLRFAAALERKFGQFAFPDEFDLAVRNFRGRVWKRHNKPNSKLGKIYRSLFQIRFRAEPDWETADRKIAVIAVLNEDDSQEIEQAEIEKELNLQLDKIKLPEGYKWAEQKLKLETARRLSAEDIIRSQRADFDFLCY